MLTEARIQTTDLVGGEGSIVSTRLGKTGELFTADAHARYYDAVRRGNCYMAANTAALALSLNSTTATGLILYNPLGSGKALVLHELCVAVVSLPAGAAPLILTGGAQITVPTGLTALTSTGNVNGVIPATVGKAGAPVAQAYSAATIATAVIQRWIGGGTPATVATSVAFSQFIKDQIDGAIVLYPGSIISLQTLTTAITVGASMSWEEVPLP